MDSSVFKETTDIPVLDSMMRNPQYFAEAKGFAGKIVHMSPDEYMRQAARTQGVTVEETSRQVQSELVDKYAQQMSEGTKFDLGYLDFQRGEQEGRNRAMAAKKLGYKAIPVLVVDEPDKLESTISTINISKLGGDKMNQPAPCLMECKQCGKRYEFDPPQKELSACEACGGVEYREVICRKESGGTSMDISPEMENKIEEVAALLPKDLQESYKTQLASHVMLMENAAGKCEFGAIAQHNRELGDEAFQTEDLIKHTAKVSGMTPEWGRPDDFSDRLADFHRYLDTVIAKELNDNCQCRMRV